MSIPSERTLGNIAIFGVSLPVALVILALGVGTMAAATRALDDPGDVVGTPGGSRGLKASRPRPGPART